MQLDSILVPSTPPIQPFLFDLTQFQWEVPRRPPTYPGVRDNDCLAVRTPVGSDRPSSLQGLDKVLRFETQGRNVGTSRG